MANILPSSHRLGFQGQWGLSDKLVATADRIGLVIQKDSLRSNQYTLHFVQDNNQDQPPHTPQNSTHKLDGILPAGMDHKESYSFKELKTILKFLNKPIEEISKKITQDKKLSNETRKDLHAVLRFASAGLIIPQKVQHDNFDSYHEEHDDECEIVAQEMEDEAAWRNDNELASALLPGLRFSRAESALKLDLNHTPVAGAAQQDLQNAIYTALSHAKGHDITAQSAASLTLSVQELDKFCSTIHTTLQNSPKLLSNALLEEQTDNIVSAVQERLESIEESEHLTQLAAMKPDMVDNTAQRLAALALASDALENFIQSDGMQKIWKKYNITKRNDPRDINELAEELGALKTALAHFTQNGEKRCDLASAEAITAEFRDIIGFGRLFSKQILSSLPDGAESGFEQHRKQWGFLEDAFAHSSLAEVSVAREYIADHGRSVSHYLGRHTGTEGIDYIESFNDFLDDFGGEVIGFVQKNPVLSAVSVVGLYYMMNSGNGGAEMIVLPSEFQAAAVIDPITGMPLTTDTPQDIVFKQCHWHSPVKLPFFEHCLMSNQALAQLEDAYSLAKAPLSMILHAPEDGMSIISDMRGTEAPVFTFAESFNTSLKNAGDFYFVANGYQNLAHAPWFGIAATMGWALGAREALKRTSFLITPLVDAGYSLAVSKPLIVAGAASAAAYGYSMQGLSGAVSGAFMGAFPGWAAHSVVDVARKIPELDYFKDRNIGQSLTHNGVTQRKMATLVDHQDYTMSYTLPPVTMEPVSGAGNHTEGAVYKALPETHVMDATLNLAGANTAFTLDAQSFKKLEIALSEMLFILETQADKIGIEEDQERYKSELFNTAKNTLDAMQLYKAESDLTYSGYDGFLKQQLQSGLKTLVGAEMKHTGRSHIFDALGVEMTRRQKGEFVITAEQNLRGIERVEAHKNDLSSLKTVFGNAAKSLGNFKSEPLLVPLSLGYKAASTGRAGLKMAFREIWYQACARFSDVRFQWNKIEPKTKGHVIGAGLAVTAAAVGTDMSPQIEQIVQNTAGQSVNDGLHGVSSVAGHAAGASTATGLFAVYNFVEDHMVIHVGLGYLFIAAAAGIKNFGYKPVQYGVLKPATVIGQGLADVARDKFGADAVPAIPLNGALKSVRDYLAKAKNYDQDHFSHTPEQG